MIGPGAAARNRRESCATMAESAGKPRHGRKIGKRPAAKIKREAAKFTTRTAILFPSRPPAPCR